MYHEINVALNGTHLFATHERSIVSMDDLARVTNIFLKKFPESEGFSISVYTITQMTKPLDVEMLKYR